MVKMQNQGATRAVLTNFVNQDIIDSSGAEFTSDDKDPHRSKKFSYFQNDQQFVPNQHEENKNYESLELNGINETCFFKNQQDGGTQASAVRGISHTGQSINRNSNFENTKSHDAFFQSSLSGGKLFANLQNND